jgi:hypothetical protein
MITSGYIIEQEGSFGMKILKWLKRVAPAIVVSFCASAFAGVSQPGVVQSGGLSAPEVTGIVSTSTVAVAELAASLGLPGGSTTLRVLSDGALEFVITTNTTSVIVTETSGEGYNGPAVGTVWNAPAWDVNQWTWPTVGGFALYKGSADSADVVSPGTSVGCYSISGTWEAASYGFAYLVGALLGDAQGEFSLAWVTATTTNTYHPMNGGFTGTALGGVFSHGLLMEVTP